MFMPNDTHGQMVTVTPENGEDRLRDLRAQDRDREKEREQERKNPPFIQLTKRKMPELREHLRKNPLAVEIFLFIAQHMGRENILICSLDVLVEETKKSRASVCRAIKYLKDESLVYAVKFGSCSGYALDGEYVWTTFHHPGRYAVFENAKALASRSENKTIAKKLSTVFYNQPPLPGLEPEEGQ